MVSSIPKNPSMAVDPKRTARIMDEGVCASGTLALPQREFDNHFDDSHLVFSGQLDPSLIWTRPGSQEGMETPEGPIAPAEPGSSDPKNTSAEARDPGRTARIVDEGVCAAGTLTLPRCESDTLESPVLLRTTGQCNSLIGNVDPLSPHIDAAKAAWSKSALLSAKAKREEKPRSVG
ncbi:hypothetical protein PCASD_14959 [Puccinia coronata f. sp. avenae]|uniref:Uncharacterized protein n=1 Tax=Puccinia coronata f. sp. avenae TaxID=200324 RepID=A0A2N5U7H8_9BASI|nr:hypothetical protein PCASD_14959 [Puccinia coronata f. sp. avenae]